MPHADIETIIGILEENKSVDIIKRWELSAFEKRVAELQEGERRLHTLIYNNNDPEDFGVIDCGHCGMPLYEQRLKPLRIQKTILLCAVKPASYDIEKLNQWFSNLNSEFPKDLPGLMSAPFELEKPLYGNFFGGGQHLVKARLILNRINGYEKLTMTTETTYAKESRKVEFIQEVQYEERLYCEFCPDNDLNAKRYGPYLGTALGNSM